MCKVYFNTQERFSGMYFSTLAEVEKLLRSTKYGEGFILTVTREDKPLFSITFAGGDFLLMDHRNGDTYKFWEDDKWYFAKDNAIRIYDSFFSVCMHKIFK